ncbi:MAG: hypothetical protein APF81_01270 [Desulfosporosinus sp. BRH_c37]|nr:MAG: hypothetical protein APF81_01270 [Desulfosporosinus sp. BRH_c37]
MKVLGFMGSPRKGANCDILLEEFLAGAKSAGADIEKIYVYDLKINDCQGCYMNCFVDNSECPRWSGSDDMDNVHEKMKSSDLIVFSSPVYCGTPPSKVMALLERTIDQKAVNMETHAHLYNNMKEKRVVILQTNAYQGLKYQDLPLAVYKYILGEAWKMNIMDSFGVAGLKNAGDIKKCTEELKKAYDLAAKICSKIKS